MEANACTDGTAILDRGIEIGARVADPRILPEIAPYTIIPEGYFVAKLEERPDFPRNLKQRVNALTPDSFIKYFQDYGNESSRIFADVQTQAVTAYLDYHEKDAARWNYHVLSFQFRHSKEWLAWTKHNATSMDQVTFAQFLEDNLAEVINPAPADLLQVALRFEAKKAVNFSSGTRLQNGEIQFTYEETISGSAQKGTLEIPDTFTLALAPFDGSPRYELTARLRYKIGSGGLQMRYELIRPDKVSQAAAEAIVGKIQEGLPDATITFGSIS